MKSKNSKTYIEPAIFLLTAFIILISIIGPLILGYALFSTEEDLVVLTDEDKLALYSLALLVLAINMFLLLTMAPRGWATISLYEDRVTWRAPFRRSVTLKYDEIKFAGIDFSDVQTDTSVMIKEAEILYMTAYIYLSVLPYMPRRGKEFKKVYNEDGIIMFKYTEKLCPALAEKLSGNLGNNLKEFDQKIKALHNKRRKNKKK